jgi:hypothetical protein
MEKYPSKNVESKDVASNLANVKKLHATSLKESQ